MTKNAGNLAKGDYIDFRGAPHLVTKTEFMNPGKGGAIMRIKMRNVQTGAVAEFTYKAPESVEILPVDKKELQYLYHDDKEVVFMDPRSYEQAAVPATLLEDQLKFLVPDINCWVLWYQGKAIGVTLPMQVKMKIVESEDATAGNRVNSPKKPAKTETGLEISVPLFVKEGEVVNIDTSTGEYLSRAS